MKKEQVIKMWKQGYAKNKIVDEYLDCYKREAILRGGAQKKQSARELREEAQKQVEKFLLEWWREEVLEAKK